MRATQQPAQKKRTNKTQTNKQNNNKQKQRGIFFPARAPPSSAKDVGRQRLQMVLVADRCGLSPRSIVAMKRRAVRALGDSMDVADMEDVAVRLRLVFFVV